MEGLTLFIELPHLKEAAGLVYSFKTILCVRVPVQRVEMTETKADLDPILLSVG